MKFENGIYSDDIEFTADDVVADTMGDLMDLIVSENKGKKAFSCVLPTGHVADMTYDDLGYYSDLVAVYLREEMGFKSGDVIALMAPNIMSYPLVAIGVFKAGLQLTNINPMYTAEEANHQLKDSGAKAMFVVDVFGDKLATATEGTKVKTIFNLSLLDMYSFLTRKILGFVLRYVKKVVPAPTVPFDADFSTVLGVGQNNYKNPEQVKAYRKGQESGETAVYQYTGGTTGPSKGAELTHGNLVGNISQANVKNMEALKEKGHTIMLMLPLYHVYAFAVGFISSLMSGSHVVLVPAPRPMSNVKPVFDKFDITILPGLNTIFLALMAEDWFVNNPPKNLEKCFSGAAPLQPAVAKKWEDLTKSKIYEGYGLTEGTCIVTSQNLAEMPLSGSVGKLMPGTYARIVDDEGNDLPQGEAGELLISGPQIMKGYLNRPDVNAEAFVGKWLKTGDVARFDEEGNMYIVDRIKDMVIVSGFNVFPTNIEAVLTKCDQVEDAAVVGVPCPDTGEKLVAYVIPSNDQVSEDEVIEECRKHLTGYKVPKVIRFIDEMPKSPVGKVLRRELREKALAEEV